MLSTVLVRTNKQGLLTKSSVVLTQPGLGVQVDITQNVTCFAPSDSAFLSAGSPELNLNVTELENAVLFHTVVFPLYTSFLVDGLLVTTFSNDTLRITIRDGDIFVNDAKIINSNIM